MRDESLQVILCMFSHRVLCMNKVKHRQEMEASLTNTENCIHTIVWSRRGLISIFTGEGGRMWGMINEEEFLLFRVMVGALEEVFRFWVLVE